MNETNEETLKYFVKKGFLLDNSTLNFFTNFGDKQVAEEVFNRIFNLTKQRMITQKILIDYYKDIKVFFNQINSQQSSLFMEFFKPAIDSDINKISAPNLPKDLIQIPTTNNPVKILHSDIIPYRKIEVKDFVNHFRNRYNFIKEILRQRKELNNLISINKIGNNLHYSIIGLVSNKRVTKNKNIILEIEDLTGKINALIGHDKEDLFKKAQEIVLDDVIALKCSGNGEITYVNDIFFPESYISEKKKLEKEVYALFISDIHVGSTLFLKENFERFLDWINGIGYDENHKEKMKKIKYLFVVGDNVDGVGVYPSQELFLKIKDIKDQYKELARYFEKIPKHISIVMCPGQHDAVRVPEPQPPIDEEFGEDLLKLKNLYLVTNPALVEVESANSHSGVKVLMYHGASMHSWIDSIEDLRQGKANLNPSKVVKYILKHRHLSPIHSGNVYVPGEKEDSMLIKEVPDIIATGDMHRTDIDLYNNILIICSSCWQSKTPFEEKVGNEPDPCKIPMLNLKTREIKILDFSNIEQQDKLT